jgi:hypothetical protein
MRIWLGALPLAVIAILFFVELPVCPSKLALGAPCPGCGLTRATHALFQLDFLGAATAHPLVFLVLPILGWVLLRQSITGFGFRSPPLLDALGRWPMAAYAGLVVLLLVVWVVRLATGWHPDPIAPESGWLTGLVF